MNAVHATRTKKLDTKAVETTVHTILGTEFALVTGQSTAFETYELCKEGVALLLPQ